MFDGQDELQAEYNYDNCKYLINLKWITLCVRQHTDMG